MKSNNLGIQKPSAAEGKLGILIPGMGAVATTFIAGVESVKKGLSLPIGSVTQMSTIRLGKRTENRQPLVKDFVPLAQINDIVFGGWDIFDDNMYEAAKVAEVLESQHLEPIREALQAIQPMPAVFDKTYIRNLDGPNIKKGSSKMDLADQLMKDIEQFIQKNGCSRAVMVWCASTEKYVEPSAVHQSLQAFERGLMDSDPMISPSMIYAYAALKMSIPFANGAPNLTCDIPALEELAYKPEPLESPAGFRPIFWVTAMEKYLMIRKISRPRKFQNSVCLRKYSTLKPIHPFMVKCIIK